MTVLFFKGAKKLICKCDCVDSPPSWPIVPWACWPSTGGPDVEPTSRWCFEAGPAGKS